jgi:hypothetical protein
MQPLFAARFEIARAVARSTPPQKNPPHSSFSGVAPLVEKHGDWHCNFAARVGRGGRHAAEYATVTRENAAPLQCISRTLLCGIPVCEHHSCPSPMLLPASSLSRPLSRTNLPVILSTRKRAWYPLIFRIFLRICTPIRIPRRQPSAPVRSSLCATLRWIAPAVGPMCRTRRAKRVRVVLIALDCLFIYSTRTMFLNPCFLPMHVSSPISHVIA